MKCLRPEIRKYTPQKFNQPPTALGGIPIKLSPLIAAAIVIFSSTLAANAEIVVSVTEQAGDVVFQYSGTVDLASTLGKEADRNSSFRNSRFEGGSGAYSAIQSREANVENDDYNLSFVVESSFSGSSLDDFGFDGGVVAGDSIIFETGAFDQIWVPDNYVSGDFISGSLTFVGTDFIQLGLEPEIAIWEWANGSVSDSFVVNVGAVPEPTALPLISAIALLVFGRRRKS